MADFLLFNEGRVELAATGLPATCTFELSTLPIGSGNLEATDTHAGGYGLATGTGYSSKTEAEPALNGSTGEVAFAVKTWATGAATDWPANVYSVVLRDSTTSKLLCAWHLQAGGAGRAMNAANTTENFTPTLTMS